MLGQGNRQIGGHGCLSLTGDRAGNHNGSALFLLNLPAHPDFQALHGLPVSARDALIQQRHAGLAVLFISLFLFNIRKTAHIRKIYIFFQFLFGADSLFQEHVKAEDHQPRQSALYRPSPVGAPNHDLPAGVGGHACLVQNFQAGFSQNKFCHFRITLDHLVQHIVGHLRVIGGHGHGEKIRPLLRLG